MTACHAFLHCLLVKWCLTFQKTFLKEQWNKSASKQQNTKINPIPDWSCPMYFMGVEYGVLSPLLVFITLTQISEKYWLALHMTKNWHHVAKTVSVFPIPVTHVRLLDEVLSSSLLLGENPAKLMTMPVLTNCKECWPFSSKPLLWRKDFLRSVSYEGKGSLTAEQGSSP